MATLRTLCWSTIEGVRSCREIVIPLRVILCVQPNEKDKGDTCLIQVTQQGSITIDVSFVKMRAILDEYDNDLAKSLATGGKHPLKNFNTHPNLVSVEEDFPKTSPSSVRNDSQ